MAEVKKEKQHITLHIYDQTIPVTVPSEQEQSYREAASFINERVNAYYSAWKGKKSDKEILYYAMIDMALQYVSAKGRNDVEPYDNILKKLTSEIEAVLK